MADGKRPGGLTALAVLNFLGAAYDLLLQCLPMLFLLFFIKNQEMFTKEMSEGEQENLDRSLAELDKIGGEAGLWGLVITGAVFAVLLIIAGIGYLKQKRVMGRNVGTIYAVLSLLFHIGFVVLVGLKFEMLLAFVYPVLTLILLNTTFKDDLVN